MANALVPELSVSDWSASRQFYTEVLGFEIVYERPEEGFSLLRLGTAELMIDQIGIGRDFCDAPMEQPFGRGVNLQIEAPAIAPLVKALAAAGYTFALQPEEKWYRMGTLEGGSRQFAVADPDGYLLRFFEDMGMRETARCD